MEQIIIKIIGYGLVGYSVLISIALWRTVTKHLNEPTIITTKITFKSKDEIADKIESEDEVTPVAKIETANKKATAE